MGVVHTQEIQWILTGLYLSNEMGEVFQLVAPQLEVRPIEFLHVFYFVLECSVCTQLFLPFTMRPNISAALLVLLLPFVQFQPTVQTRTEHELSLLKDVIVANTQQYFLETKDSKEQSVLNTRDQLLKIVLHDYGMKGLDENALSTRAISNHLAVRRKSIAKHRSNKIPFKKMQASRKKQGLSKQSFIFQHNPLCQLMVQFWNEHSTPSPNKKDVKWIHSKQPGDHVRVHNEDNTTFTVQCTTSKCRKDQRR